MGFLKSLMIRVGADTSGVDKELKKASRQLIATGKEWEKVGAGLTKAVTLPILAVGAASIKMGLEAKETEEKFTYAFGSMTDSVRAWSDSLAKARGLDAFDLRNTASDMQTLAKGFGFTNDAASEMAKGLAEAAYAMAEIYEVDAATMADNFSSAFKGRANALKDYGIVIDDVSVKAYAYANGIAKVGKELTTAQKAQAMYGLIMQGAADEMAEFQRTGSDVATTLKNKLTTALKEFGVALVNTGTFDKLVDVLTRVLDKALELATAFANLPNGMQETIIAMVGLAALLGPLVSGFGSLVGYVGNLGIAAAGSGTALGAGGLLGTLGQVGIALAGITGGFVLLNEGMGLLDKWTGSKNKVPMPWDPKDNTGINWKGNLKPGDPGFQIPKISSADLLMGAQGYNRYAGMDAYYGSVYGKGGAMYDPTAAMAAAQKKQMDDLNKAMAEQQRLMEKQEKAAKAAAALDAFRNSVKSLAQAMLDAGRQFANFVGMFDKVERENVSGNRLAKRMEGQLRAMQDWVSAMGSLKGKVSDSLYRELLNMGPGAVDQIKALLNDSGALARYEAAYNERNKLAGDMGTEAAKANYKAEQVIEKQINNITVTGSDPQKVADLVIQKLRLAGVY